MMLQISIFFFVLFYFLGDDILFSYVNGAIGVCEIDFTGDFELASKYLVGV